MADITSTAEIAETEWGGHSEPSDVATDMVATTEAEGHGIEFHVSMRDYTQRDMEALIIEAAAMQIVGRFGDKQIAHTIEAKCIELINAKATKALESVTTEIIDQPLMPNFGDKKPVTMREFLGLYGREYLTEKVDHDGKVGSGNWNSTSVPRIEWLVGRYMDRTFKTEIEKASNAAIAEIQNRFAAKHKALIEAEMTRVREALAATFKKS